MHSIGICLMLFSGLDSGYCLGEEDGRVKYNSHHIKRTSIKMTYLLMLTLITWLEVVFVRFLHCKVALFSSFSVLYSLKGDCYVQPTLVSWELYSVSLRPEYLCKLLAIFLHGPLSLLPYLLFSSLFISVWIPRIFILFIGFHFALMKMFYVLSSMWPLCTNMVASVNDKLNF